MALIRFRTSKGIRLLKLRKVEKSEEEAIKTGYIQPTPGPAFLIGKGIMPEAAFGMQMQQATMTEEEMKAVPQEGIDLPDIVTEKTVEPLDIEKEDLSSVDIRYPLIPNEPRHGERVYAYAHIFWDPKEREVIYRVIEPQLGDREKRLLADIKDYIQEKIDIDFTQVKKKEAIDYLLRVFEKALAYFHFDDAEGTIKYYIFRDFIGLESIEPLLKDRHIEDISCDGANIPIYVYHRSPKLGSLKTNLKFEDKNELDSFVNKLAERTGKVISVAKPLLDGTLPDGSRVQATLGSDIARQGSNFTIRMFTERPLTPTDMIKLGTSDIKMMAYLWYLIEQGRSMLISGGTATGKTSLLNVLSLFIKPQMKIVSIEDTAELRLPHPHWVPEVAREAISEAGGAVDMYELLRESLRQRPDYIIVGEVRGKEAYVLFQQMAVGHPGLSTIHAENVPKLIDRLTTPPISLPANLIQNLDILIFLKRVKRGNTYIRKISTVFEVLGYDRKNNTPIINRIFEWDSKTDKFKTVHSSKLLKKAAEAAGKTDDFIKEEIEKRAKVMRWMHDQNITDYMQIGKILNLFYTNAEILLAKIGEAE